MSTAHDSMEIVTCVSKPISTDDVEVVLPLLRLLSEPNRLRIFVLLAQGELCVCHIEENQNLPQNLVSHHLGVLREAGLISARRDGRWVYYTVNKETLGRIYPALCRMFNPECVNAPPSCC